MADEGAGGGANPNAAFEDVKKQYLDSMLRSIEKRALEMAKVESRDKINHVDAVKAFEEHFAVRGLEAKPPSWAKENLFLLIITAMTLIFGAMGLLPYLFGAANPEKIGFSPAAFLDMAKLFAGVIVGGAAGATVAGSISRRTKSP